MADLPPPNDPGRKDDVSLDPQPVTGSPREVREKAKEKERNDDAGAPISPSAEDQRLEYAEINLNIRHYSSLRFAIITVFFAATGGIASVAFNFFGNDSANVKTMQLCARIAGFLITLLFFQYEYLVGSVLLQNRSIGQGLEKKMGLTLLSSRRKRPIKVAHWLARILYAGFLLFWAFMIWQLARPVPITCDSCA